MSSTSPPQDPGSDAADTPLRRFERSMFIDYEKWHDGMGYDLEAIAAASPAERAVIERMLLERRMKDWRDVEALAALDTPQARRALKAAATHGPSEIRLAVARYAPRLMGDDQREAMLLQTLRHGNLFAGLSEALDQVEDFHPPAIVESLLRGALHRAGDVAVLFAGMLFYIHGKADSGFDWSQRPFFLRFDTQIESERRAVFMELCQKIGVDPNRYL